MVDAAITAGTEIGSIRRIVLGTPGLVDPRTGDIAFAFDLPAWHRGLLAALRDGLDTPVEFGNDVNLAAVAEASSGAAKGVEDFVLIWIGSGVGLATVLGGRVHRGTTGAAGEIGYLPVAGEEIPRDAPRRGVNGAFQQQVGADAVKAIGKEHGFKGADGADIVRAAVAAGDEGAPVLDELARRLALGVAVTCLVLDPSLVVLAGEIGTAGGFPLAERVEREASAITVVSPRVTVSQIDAEPVLHGALWLALDAVRDDVFGSTTG